MNGDFSQKLNQVLSNPAMMAQIKALADTMTENNAQTDERTETMTQNVRAENLPEKLPAAPIFSPSPSFERNLQNACALLNALKPFLDNRRQEKIDKMLSMMQFAKMAGQFGNFF
ncbi:MAG: hypothetical protein IKD07_07195 [Clostridia bacterium]|nr:hypothetical protein [Clostridia bacterium]